MPKDLYLYTDGKSLKSIDLPQYPDSAWNFITEPPEDYDEDLYSSVAAVFRAVNLSADTLAGVPFAIVGKSGEDYDTSEDYKNKVGFMENPSELFRLWRMSLFMTNSAYGFMEGNKVKKNLRYIVPQTMTPIVNKVDGLTGFKRQLGTETVKYSLDDNRIVWMFRRDHTTELLPAKHTEFKALMSAAGIINYADYYISQFFQRGGIKPTVLSVKGVPNREEREKIEGIWDKLVHGWTKYLGKVFNADAMDFHTIGEGIENLKDSAMHTEKLGDIAMAAGMPLSLLLANSANYATAKIEYVSWFRNSIIPWCSFMADALNDVLFDPMGLCLEFRPEMAELGQEEEVQRSIAYARYVQSGINPSVAAQIVGVDLPPNVSYDMLDKMKKESVELENQRREQSLVDRQPGEPGEESDPAQQYEEKAIESVRFSPGFKQIQEINLWHDIARRKLKRGEGMGFDFTSTLPDDIHTIIAAKIALAETQEQLEQAFDLTDAPVQEYKTSEIFQLVNALNNAVEVIQ